MTTSDVLNSVVRLPYGTESEQKHTRREEEKIEIADFDSATPGQHAVQGGEKDQDHPEQLGLYAFSGFRILHH